MISRDVQSFPTGLVLDHNNHRGDVSGFRTFTYRPGATGPSLHGPCQAKSRPSRGAYRPPRFDIPDLIRIPVGSELPEGLCLTLVGTDGYLTSDFKGRRFQCRILLDRRAAGPPTARHNFRMLISRAGRRCSSRYSRYGVSTSSIHFMNARTRRDRLLRCATTRDTASARRRKSGMISTSAPLSKYRPIPKSGA